jgi:hypothetical protein
MDELEQAIRFLKGLSAQEWAELESKRETQLNDLKTIGNAQLRVILRAFDLSQVIAVLGKRDVLECIGVKRCLDYIQHVGFGPVGTDRGYCRARVGVLASSFGCEDADVSIASSVKLTSAVP